MRIASIILWFATTPYAFACAANAPPEATQANSATISSDGPSASPNANAAPVQASMVPSAGPNGGKPGTVSGAAGATRFNNTYGIGELRDGVASISVFAEPTDCEKLWTSKAPSVTARIPWTRGARSDSLNFVTYRNDGIPSNDQAGGKPPFGSGEAMVEVIDVGANGLEGRIRLHGKVREFSVDGDLPIRICNKPTKS